MAIRLVAGVVAADFEIPRDPTRALRVMFEGASIVRLLDESAISTEEAWPDQGYVPDQFAYRVEGSRFETSQSSTWKWKHRPVSQWRFITAGTCMDVLSKSSPTFSLVSLEGGQVAMSLQTLLPPA